MYRHAKTPRQETVGSLANGDKFYHYGKLYAVAGLRWDGSVECYHTKTRELRKFENACLVTPKRS